MPQVMIILFFGGSLNILLMDMLVSWRCILIGNWDVAGVMDVESFGCTCQLGSACFFDQLGREVVFFCLPVMSISHSFWF